MLTPTSWAESEFLFGALAKSFNISFEFFPVSQPEKMDSFVTDLERLSLLNPDFVSVTYGALNGNRKDTQQTINLIQQRSNMPVAAHLTNISHTQEDIEHIAQEYWKHGVRHIVALRGDLPANENSHSHSPKFAVDLVKQLKNIHDFEISVAAYPEVHPQARSRSSDLDNLKAKVDAGATRAITQFFFDPDVFIEFKNRVIQAGIQVELIPGILPVFNFNQALKFATQTGVSVPNWIHSYFDSHDDDPQVRQALGLNLALEQTKRLLQAGTEDFHFYTLNRSTLVYSLCCALGKRPIRQQAA